MTERTGPNSIPKESVLLRRKTGTTIVSVPFNEGYIIVTDLRATNTSTLEVFTCDSKIEKQINGNFVICGAGYSIGTEYCAKPFFQYLYKKLSEYHYDLNEETNLQELKSKIAAINIDFLKQVRDPSYGQVLSGCVFLLGFCSENLVGTWVSNLVGQTQRRSKTTSLNPYTTDHKDLIGIGSGSRYARGYLCGLNQVQAFKNKDFKRALGDAIASINNATCIDLGSSILEGLSVAVLKKGGVIEFYKWIPTSDESWSFKDLRYWNSVVKINDSFTEDAEN